MPSTDLNIRRSGDLLHIELARPAKRNALTTEMYRGVADALAEAERNSSIRTVLFSGAGQSFCAGNDLADFVAHPPTDSDPPVFRFITALAEAKKILIAAVQGRAVGIGTTMLLHCDFVFAEPDAELQMPFVDLGLVPEAGSSLLLPSLVGGLRAAELLLLGEKIGAERAVQLGLISRVVAAGQAVVEARAVAAKLSEKPAEALVATKTLMKSPMRDLKGRIAEENAAFVAYLQKPAFRRVVEKFFEGRGDGKAR
jgi:enoyl-CoA hydratase/carnithine racemase